MSSTINACQKGVLPSEAAVLARCWPCLATQVLPALTSPPPPPPPHHHQGRATLEAKVQVAETPSGPQEVVMTIVLDGYNAPVSAGNFADLVLRKFYDGMEVQRADGFVVQTGDPDGPEDGFKDPATGEIRRWGARLCGGACVVMGMAWV